MKLLKLILWIIILAVVYILVEPIMVRIGLLIGINISPLAACIILLLLAWAIS